MGVENKVWDNEDGLHIVFKNNFFHLEKKLSLFFVYCKPSDSPRQDLDTEGDCFDKIEIEICHIYDQNDIIIVGDTNSRVASRQEVCFMPLSTFNHDFFDAPIYENAFIENDFLECNFSVTRSNQDTKTNDNGLKLINLCYTMDLAIMNGRAFSDKGIGLKTFSGARGESCVDHLICNKSIMKKLADFQISNYLEYSDHKFLTFKMKSYKPPEVEQNDANKRLKWRDEFKETFIASLEDNNVEKCITEMTDKLVLKNNENTLTEAINLLEITYQDAGKCHTTHSNYKPKHDKGAKWFGKDCYDQKKKFILARDKFNLNDSDENRELMCSERNKYRKVCRKSRTMFKRTEADRLVKLSKNDPKMFWKDITSGNKLSENTNCNFFEHFKKLANTNVVLEESAKEEINSVQNNAILNNNSVEELDTEITMDD